MIFLLRSTCFQDPFNIFPYFFLLL
ncbi:hypothetical protein NC653_033848 [Populus alba x Populus x berolinensis]|uniref:Uncharacterized protein n=1 Tax=Populus alba x Populus x berolinensis TaxID=444605 RepID=A0AAD6LXL1_9ROSI|nr:hypothetical protein NC653_033848 [Populus alba x Populus x berolinensis]